LSSCTFKLTNTGAAAATDPALHPQDERAALDSDIYRLSATASGAGWSAELRNALATAKFGESVDVPVSISHAAGAEPGNTVTLKATSVSDVSKTATATCASTSAGGTVGGAVPATLSLTLGAPATFGAFQPGVDKEYFASTTATVTSTAGDATLSSSEPGHLTNGAFSLPEPLQVSFSKSTWDGPASNDASTITFRQHIGAKDALRTGAYAKTLTFTLATTNP
jgi:hypothetical protein